MSSDQYKKDQWVCECGYPLSGEINGSTVDFRNISKQETEVEYFRMSAKCRKCGKENQKTGDMYEDMKLIQEVLQFSVSNIALH